jgi:hypothetical protein
VGIICKAHPGKRNKWQRRYYNAIHLGSKNWTGNHVYQGQMNNGNQHQCRHNNRVKQEQFRGHFSGLAEAALF